MLENKVKEKFEIGDSTKCFDTLGCSPETIQDFNNWLLSYKNKVKELHIALYLFNNRELFKTLMSLAYSDCKIIIYSIPLEGYDDKPGVVFNHKDNTILAGDNSKKDFAEAIYNEIQSCKNENIELRIVPHMYLRSARVKKFSRGKIPYSLHCKTFYMTCNDGISYAGITSSNLAIRDMQKIELSAIIELSPSERIAAADFYEGLFENSISIKNYDELKNYSHFKIKMRRHPIKTRLQYIAPFYENSASEFENRIKTMVLKAKKRIIVCAQHISSYDYCYEKRFTSANFHGIDSIKKEGFLNKVLEKSQEGIEVVFLSQTYVDPDDPENKKYRTPANKSDFSKFIKAAKKVPCEYHVNSNIHCKFIVIDNHVILTTCNFTPTQFIYLPNVNIPEFKNIPGFSYSGIHCEHGVYYVVTDEEFANKIVEYVNTIIDLEETEKTI